MSTKSRKTAEAETVVEQNKVEYDTMLAVISEVEVGDVVAVQNPPEVVIGEAETLFSWAKKDQDALVNAGLPADAIDRLQPASGALRYAQSMLKKCSEEPDGWKAESQEAFELHDIILHHFFYAFRNNPEKLKKVHEIAEGNTNDDKIQQLQTFCLFGRENSAQLEQIGFDVALLDKAAELSARMGDLLGEKRANRKRESDARTIRDQAYVYLKGLMNRIRECGRYVFYRDEERVYGYASDYDRKKRKRYKKEEVPEVREAEAAGIKAAA
ncbi:MAG: hypothetical protein JW913_17085 [Chitinispirillaceae bacterium]|nr:hypothetical protein [Chitinispirillaceae bacterium]